MDIRVLFILFVACNEPLELGRTPVKFRGNVSEREESIWKGVLSIRRVSILLTGRERLPWDVFPDRVRRRLLSLRTRPVLPANPPMLICWKPLLRTPSARSVPPIVMAENGRVEE